jgi:hypothetical protein
LWRFSFGCVINHIIHIIIIYYIILTTYTVFRSCGYIIIVKIGEKVYNIIFYVERNIFILVQCHGISWTSYYHRYFNVVVQTVRVNVSRNTKEQHSHPAKSDYSHYYHVNDYTLTRYIFSFLSTGFKLKVTLTIMMYSLVNIFFFYHYLLLFLFLFFYHIRYLLYRRVYKKRD